MPPAGFPAPPPNYGAYAGTAFGGPPPGYAQPAARYASWGKRVGAYLLDGLVALVVMAPVLFIAAALYKGDKTTSVPDFNGIERTNLAPAFANYLRTISFVLSAAFTAAYQGYLQGKSGQTWGKKLLKIRVVDASTGKPIGFVKSWLLRTVLPGLLGFCCIFTIVDLLFPLWDDRKQALHDKFASSIVIEA